LWAAPLTLDLSDLIFELYGQFKKNNKIRWPTFCGPRFWPPLAAGRQSRKTDRQTDLGHANTVKTRNFQNLTNCEIFLKTIKVLYRPSLEHLSSCRSDVGEPNGTRISFATDGFINRPHLPEMSENN